MFFTFTILSENDFYFSLEITLKHETVTTPKWPKVTKDHTDWIHLGKKVETSYLTTISDFVSVYTSFCASMHHTSALHWPFVEDPDKKKHIVLEPIKELGKKETTNYAICFDNQILPGLSFFHVYCTLLIEIVAIICLQLITSIN